MFKLELTQLPSSLAHLKKAAPLRSSLLNRSREKEDRYASRFFFNMKSKAAAANRSIPPIGKT